jgi:hypothetical protein
MVEGGMEPPEGVTPDFDNPVRTVWVASIITQALCISIVGAIIGLRIYVRMRIIRSFQLEDWLITAGYVKLFMMRILRSARLIWRSCWPWDTLLSHLL